MKYDKNISSPKSSTLDQSQIEEMIEKKILVHVNIKGRKHFFFTPNVLYIRSQRDSKYIFLRKPSMILNGSHKDPQLKEGPHILKLSRCSFKELQKQIGPDLMRVHHEYAIMRPLISKDQIDYEFYNNAIRKAKKLWKQGKRWRPNLEIVYKKELFDGVKSEFNKVKTYSKSFIPRGWKVCKHIPVSEKYINFNKYWNAVHTQRWWLGEID